MMQIVNILSQHNYSAILLINIFATITLSFVVFTWVYIIEKPISKRFVVLIFSCLPLLSMLRMGTYESGDLTFQAYKLYSFYTNLAAGHWIPRWSAELNATYGYPNFIFTYHLPYYIASLFHAIGFHLVDSVKLTLATTYLLSGILFYEWIRRHTSGKAALVGALLYQFAPYRFVTMHFRATLGESTALMILPLCALCIYVFIEKRSYVSEISVSVSLALLILSHQAMSLLGIPFLFLYCIFLASSRPKPSYLYALRPFVIGLLLSAYYWVPIIAESRYTLQSHATVIVQHFPTLQFLFSTWKYGFLFQGPRGELSPALGYLHWIAIGVALLYILKSKATPVLMFLVFIFSVYFLSAQSFSPTWQLFPILHKIQFSYRFVGILVFVSSAIAAVLVHIHMKSITRHKIFVFLFFSILFSTSILNWANRKVIPYAPQKDFIAFAPYITEKGEGFDPAIPLLADPKHPWKSVLPKEHIFGKREEIAITHEVRTHTSHLYTIETPISNQLVENTYYFPGWEVYVDNVQNPINPAGTPNTGLITFDVPEGKHSIRLIFSDTPVRRFSYLISLATACLLICYPILKHRKRAHPVY